MKYSDVQIGDRLVADGGFTCLPKDKLVTVESDGDGPFIRCSAGKHFLDGQTDDAGELIGLRAAADEPPGGEGVSP